MLSAITEPGISSMSHASPPPPPRSADHRLPPAGPMPALRRSADQRRPAAPTRRAVRGLTARLLASSHRATDGASEAATPAISHLLARNQPAGRRRPRALRGPRSGWLAAPRVDELQADGPRPREPAPGSGATSKEPIRRSSGTSSRPPSPSPPPWPPTCAPAPPPATSCRWRVQTRGSASRNRMP